MRKRLKTIEQIRKEWYKYHNNDNMDLYILVSMKDYFGKEINVKIVINDNDSWDWFVDDNVRWHFKDEWFERNLFSIKLEDKLFEI